jgi:hypothetical protein
VRVGVEMGCGRITTPQSSKEILQFLWGFFFFIKIHEFYTHLPLKDKNIMVQPLNIHSLNPSLKIQTFITYACCPSLTKKNFLYIIVLNQKITLLGESKISNHNFLYRIVLNLFFLEKKVFF